MLLCLIHDYANACDLDAKEGKVIGTHLLPLESPEIFGIVLVSRQPQLPKKLRDLSVLLLVLVMSACRPAGSAAFVSASHRRPALGSQRTPSGDLTCNDCKDQAMWTQDTESGESEKIWMDGAPGAKAWQRLELFELFEHWHFWHKMRPWLFNGA